MAELWSLSKVVFGLGGHISRSDQYGQISCSGLSDPSSTISINSMESFSNQRGIQNSGGCYKQVVSKVFLPPPVTVSEG